MAVHLLTYSCYSLLSGMMPIKELVHQAKTRGYSAIACTDLNVMYGAMEFVMTCQKQQIKPILGMVIECKIEDDRVPFLILAKNEKGYRECIELSTYNNTNTEAISFDQLALLTQDCITIVLSEGGWLEADMMHRDGEGLSKKLQQCSKAFRDVYVGFSMNESPFWREHNEWLRLFCQNNQLPTVAISKVYYASEEDVEAYRILRGIKHGQTVNDKALIHQPHRHMLTPTEMVQLYAIEDVVTQDEIAEKISEYSLDDRTSLPDYPLAENVSSKQYLSQLCQVGLNKRCNNHIEKHYQKRLDYELKIINDMDYENYFLIIWDLIRFARIQGIYVGPGRGSSAGSLVSYVLGITHVDPIKYDLIFERFLNPQRISMPDIDIDFPDNRRDEIIHYMQNKYGKEHIAHIITFGTLAAKQSLRDVGRVYEIPIRLIDDLSKSVPNVVKITLTQAYQESARFRQILDSNQLLFQVFKVAKQIEGLPRHISTHAAGVVMSKKPLQEVVPLVQVEQELHSTQFSMDYLEKIGLIKMDLLGLRNLTIIDEIVVRMKTPIDILKIPLDDIKTFQLIQAVDTVGIFQLESEGMKSLIRKMQPEIFEDIVATIALFRPGPMKNIAQYLEARKKPQQIQYLLPELKPILQSTYGIMIYQEQIMIITQKIAGFTLAKADILRKAISKKNEAEISALRQDFIAGCIKSSVAENKAIQLFDDILEFANYGFNKSHSVAYALISYQMAYLKANFPLLFYTSLLTSVIGSESKTMEYLDECRQRHVRILKPSINLSRDYYSIEENAIRFPLLAIKGLGFMAYQTIAQERQKRGLFTDFFDFVARIMTHRFQSKWIEILIWAGACDEFCDSRATLIASLDEALNYADLVRIEVSGQTHINLDLVSRPLYRKVKDQPWVNSEKEFEVLGLYLSEHPLITLKSSLNTHYPLLSSIKPSNREVTLLVTVGRMKTILTKKGETMAFISLSDESGQIDGILWPSQLQLFQELCIKNNTVEVVGILDEKGSFIIRSMVKR